MTACRTCFSGNVIRKWAASQNSSYSRRLSLSQTKQQRDDTSKRSSTDEIHHPVIRWSNCTKYPSIISTKKSSCKNHVCFFAFVSSDWWGKCLAAAEPKHKHPTLIRPLMDLSLCFFSEVSRNDSCPDLPEIQNGWKTTSHVALVRGARITYQCDPGYDLVGRETLTCQLDLSWSSQPPFCEKSQFNLILLF